jgi:hypothetical protein
MGHSAQRNWSYHMIESIQPELIYRTVYGINAPPDPNDKAKNILLIVEGVLIPHSASANEWLFLSNCRYRIVGVQTNINQQISVTEIERVVLLEPLTTPRKKSWLLFGN